MAGAELEDLCSHINEKISHVKKILQLKNIGHDPALKTVFQKIRHEMTLLNDLLNKLELEVQYQEHVRNSLRELQESLDGNYKEINNLKENIPPHLPKVVQTCVVEPNVNSEKQVKITASKHPKKPQKEQKPIKEILLITSDEFDNVPAYMKSRLTYCQINDFIKEINKAVASKYRILNLPKKSMNPSIRNLCDRFIEDENKDTKGQYFVVEADIKEFTNLKVDKRFHVILNILRHCRRLSEVRGGGLVRYVIN
ncbi:spindle and kinetochore-associated protein 1-like [Dromiciops gliroides]|uniref:spindle and kinetochore-associated protein 1 n=1 Tax=Dromiciops gliroides TaxID=33562 RepID=UPI001CC63B41|nr:spindle and kinetochore-associated protein 1 [Dromiciops gliroides]XP_043834375.1 spindle and kinetochore-associated protein 1 [Dromiciops gliroides]XP_043845700.1 spindle and kinetochore-associated protein 1-like [Dromiciops gliroides]